MKKNFALCLSLCLALGCMSTTAFATEVETTSVKRTTAAVSSAANVDYWNTGGVMILEGTQTYTISPPAGKTLKLHFYVIAAEVTFKIRPQGSLLWSKTVTWNTVGHHYADLISSTNGGKYEIAVTGKNWGQFEGGVYSE